MNPTNERDGLTKLDICEGIAGLAVYLNGERIAGVRDNGLMHTIHSWDVRASDVFTILRPTPPGAPEAVSVDGETAQMLEAARDNPNTRAFTNADIGLVIGSLLTRIAELEAVLSTPANIPADGEVERVARIIDPTAFKLREELDRPEAGGFPDYEKASAAANGQIEKALIKARLIVDTAIAALRTKADAGDGR